MTELEIGGNAYRINSMSAMTQFHVMRKLGPVLPGIVPVLAQAAATLPQGDSQEADGAMATVDGVAAIAMAAQPLLDGLASMADAALHHGGAAAFVHFYDFVEFSER